MSNNNNNYHELNNTDNNEIEKKNSVKNPLNSSVSQENPIPTLKTLKSLKIKDDKKNGEPHDVFWSKNISVLYDSNKLLKFFPTNDMNLEEKLNSICRLAIYVGLTLFIFNERLIYLLLIVFIFAFTYYIYNNKKDIIENLLINSGLSNKDIFRKSTKDNPFANYDIINAKDKDKIAMPIDNDEVKKDIENNFRKIEGSDDKLYRSTFDLFDKNNSQRQFYSTPSTSMPNDQTAFAKWCYSTGPTCKERNLYCAPN